MFARARSRGLICSAVLCTNASLAQLPASAEEPSASVVLVLDASSSMLGKIGKSTKIELARSVTHELLGNWDPRVRVGLTAYGHRQSKSCDDIEAVVPLGPLQAEAFNAAVDRLEPKGKTPLSAAIKNAADQLGYTGRKATIIVISDGIENCGGDPCAVAAELKQKGIDFTAHVVGLGAISADESKQLACIAEKTGGQYRGAKDAPALKEALGGIVQHVEVESGLGPPTLGAGGASLRQLQEQTQGNVKMLAVRTPGGLPVKTVWRIWNLGKTKQVGSADQRSVATFNLPPGPYRLIAQASNAEDGNAKADLPFEVGASTNHVLELAYNSGRITFLTFAFEGGPAISSVFRVSPDGQKKTRSGTANYRTKPDFELMAGKYNLTVELGNAEVTRAFEVQPGSDTSQNISLNVGTATLRAVTSPGGSPLHDNHWRLFAMAEDGSVGAPAGTADYRNAPDFILVEGNYVARVELDNGKQAERRFSVKAGAKTNEEIVMGP